MVLKFSFNFRDISSESVGQSTRDFSLLANPSVVDVTMGIEAAKVLLIETTIPLNKLDTAKSSVFNLFSLSAIMKLPFFVCLPVSRFN